MSNLTINTKDLNEIFQKAYERITNLIPRQRVLLQEAGNYSKCTTGVSRRIPMVILIEKKQEIAWILKIAQDLKIKVYPISTGKNWGYGTSNPVEDNCIILDLSRLTKIISFDEELGTIRLEPGVTQAQLYEYLIANNLNFLVPSTGAGPHASIVGNLLERGYGITPHTDHFGALLSLEAVLPNGEVYKSTLEDLGASEINRNFKWGLGPYLDGLFAQSNFGIVTECTISLMRKTEAIEAFIFTLKPEADVALAGEALRELSQTLPGILGGMNLMNDRRMLAMHADYPVAQVKPGHIMDQELLTSLRRQHSIEPWTGIGGIYGTRLVVAAAKRQIKKVLSPFSKEIRFVNESNLSSLKKMSTYLPSKLGGANLKLVCKRVERLLNVVSGIPTEAALPLAYWRTNKKYQEGQNKNIALDGCGLIWYSPIVINKREYIKTYVEFVERTCREFGIEPLITLTTVSERCFDSTVPILFNRSNKEELLRAQQCYKALITRGLTLGFFPYRLSVDQMAQVTESTPSVSWDMVKKIKQALDPNQILSPGRYCPRSSSGGNV